MQTEKETRSTHILNMIYRVFPYLCIYIFFLSLTGCSVQRPSYSPGDFFSPNRVGRNTFEIRYPGFWLDFEFDYWYEEENYSYISDREQLFYRTDRSLNLHSENVGQSNFTDDVTYAIITDAIPKSTSKIKTKIKRTLTKNELDKIRKEITSAMLIEKEKADRLHLSKLENDINKIKTILRKLRIPSENIAGWGPIKFNEPITPSIRSTLGGSCPEQLFWKWVPMPSCTVLVESKEVELKLWSYREQDVHRVQEITLTFKDENIDVFQIVVNNIKQKYERVIIPSMERRSRVEYYANGQIKIKLEGYDSNNRGRVIYRRAEDIYDDLSEQLKEYEIDYRRAKDVGLSADMF